MLWVRSVLFRLRLSDVGGSSALGIDESQIWGGKRRREGEMFLPQLDIYLPMESGVINPGKPGDMTVEHVLLKWLPWSTERAELIEPLCTRSLRPSGMVTTKSEGRAAIRLVKLTGIQNQISCRCGAGRSRCTSTKRRRRRARRKRKRLPD
jgi:hypothetical protein